MFDQIRNRKIVVISFALTILALANFHFVSNIASVILFLLASFLAGRLVQTFFKSNDIILCTVLGAFGILLGVSVTLGPLGGLRYDVLVLVFFAGAVAITQSLPVNLPRTTSYSEFVISAVLIGCFGLALAFALRYYSPFPIQIDTDVTKEAIRIVYIAKTGSAPILLPGDFRPIVYDTMISVISVVTGAQGSDIVWYAVYATFPLYGLGVLLLSKRFFGDWRRATVASFLSLLICGFWYLEGPAIILPETFAAIISLYLVALYLDWNMIGTKSLLIFLGLMIFFDIGYYYAVAALVPFIALLQIWPRRRLANKMGYVVVILGVALTAGAFELYGNTIGSQMTSIDFSFVEQFMTAAYTPILLAFIAAGFVSIFFVTKDKSLFPVAIFSIIVLLILVLPISFATRIEIFVRPELAMVGAAGLVSFVSLVDNPQSKKGLALMCILLVVVAPIMIRPYESWFTGTVPVSAWHGLSIETFSEDEGEAGLWLRQNVQTGFVISDLESSAIMQSISGLSGMYNPIYFLNNLTLLNLTYAALASNYTATSLNYLRRISSNTNFYYVITSRTETSIRQWESLISSDTLTFQSTQDLIVSYPTGDPPYSDSLFDNFTLVYSNPSVDIYRAP